MLAEVLDELLFELVIPPAPPELVELPPSPACPPAPVVTELLAPDVAAVSASPEHPETAIAAAVNIKHVERMGVVFMATLDVIIIAAVFREFLCRVETSFCSKAQEILHVVKMPCGTEFRGRHRP